MRNLAVRNDLDGAIVAVQLILRDFVAGVVVQVPVYTGNGFHVT